MSDSVVEMSMLLEIADSGSGQRDHCKLAEIEQIRNIFHLAVVGQPRKVLHQRYDDDGAEYHSQRIRLPVHREFGVVVLVLIVQGLLRMG